MLLEESGSNGRDSSTGSPEATMMYESQHCLLFNLMLRNFSASLDKPGVNARCSQDLVYDNG